MKEYVPIFFDWTEVTEELNAEEKGRLIDAIVLYAQGGDWQSRIQGNERYLFPAFRKQIDRANEKSENKSAAATQREAQKAQLTTKSTTDHKIAKEKEKEKDKEKEEYHENACAARFDQFWAAYPRHTAKQAALRAFQKLNPGDQLMGTILTAIQRQRASPQWRDGERFIPHPATWINGKRWEDDVIADQPRPAPRALLPAQQYEQRQYSPEYYAEQDARRFREIMEQYYERHPEEAPHADQARSA